jgi:hypothetical protein
MEHRADWLPENPRDRAAESFRFTSTIWSNEQRAYTGDTQDSIYERAFVKRGGADFVFRVSRTSPSPSASVDLAHLRPVRGQLVVQPATHPLSPRPRESYPPSMPAVIRSVSRRDVIRSTIYSGSTGLPDVATKPVSKGRHHSRSRKSAMGPLSGCLSGSSTWSSRPPAFARLVARSLNGVRFGSLSAWGQMRSCRVMWSGSGTVCSF